MFKTDERSLRDEPPDIATYLSQGAVVTAPLGFLSLVGGMLSHPHNGYNFFLMLFLPSFVFGAMVLGAFEGTIIWACTYFAGRRLNIGLRACIGLIVHAAVMNLIVLLYGGRATYQEDVSTTVYLLGIFYYFVFGVVFGLLVGSRFEPIYEFIRGTTSTPWLSVETGLTGFALRVAVLFGFMESVLSLIWQHQREEISSEQTMALIAVIHFVVAGVIVFARMPIWLLVPLALLVNVPIVLYFTEVLTGNDGGMRILTIFYLSVWFVFLATRLIGMSPSGEKSVTT